MASVCKKQQCTIDRRGFRQELDSWRHKLIHCVGFESILEGLIGPELLEDLKEFKDFEPVAGSDWSFKENCLFCCLRRDKVKEHLIGLNKGGIDDTSKPLLVKDQLTIIRLEKQAEEFLCAVLSRKDAPNVSDPHVPVVAREILQKMISQLAAEYTSKPSSPQDSRSDSPPPSDQSLPAPLSLTGAPPMTPAATLAGPAHNQNPVLSKLLMADQDAPLDLTVKKPLAEPAEQDGVLDLSIKKNRYSSSSSLPGHNPCFSPTTSTLKRRSLSVDGQVGLFRRSLQDGRKRENFGHSTSNNPTSSLAYSLHIKEEANLEIDPESPLGYNPRSSPTTELLRNTSSSSSNSNTHFGALLKLKTSSGADKHLKDIPRLLEAAGLFPNSLSTEKGNLKDACKDQSLSLSRSSSFDLKIPQVRVLATGAESSWDSLSTEYSGSTCENGLRKKLCAILPRQIQKRSSVGSNSSGSEKDYWPFPSDHQSSGASYSMDSESDPGNKQPRKKRGRYRQYNTELLEEAILVVMGGKMSVSKAQSIYGIPHSTLEYKVKERLGTLKHPPKKKMKLISQMDNQPQSPEGQELLMFQNIDPEDREKASEDSGTVLHDGDVLSNDEPPDFRVAKVKDLQSTSTLEQFMAKLCSHHQRQIVDAIGFLQMEVKAHASSKASNSAAGGQGTACSDEKFSRVIPDKSLPAPKLPGESTPEAEPQELSHSVPKSCALKKIPENAVSLKSSADSALDIFSLESENNQPLATANSVDGEDNRPSDHVPLRMKIMASNAAAGKKLSCVLDGNLSSHSETVENNQSNINSSTRVESHSARLSTSSKRHSQMSLIQQARQLEVFEHPKDMPAKVFPVHVTIPSDSARTARKTTRTLSEHQIRDSICREMVDPDFGHCDIVFIDKPITECFNKKRRSMVPRRNARKSTRGHMYSDEIWELKTVRTLAGRGNCPNPMPELITLITPKQILSKPEGVPPVDMPFVGACTETMNQQTPTEKSDESLTPGAGDVVEVAASKADVVVEMSQTDQCQNKGQSNPPSPLILPTENRESVADTYAEQDVSTDSGMTIQNAEVVDRPPHDATKENGPESPQVIHDNTEQTLSEAEVEPLEITATEGAESQLTSDKHLSSELLPQQNDTSAVSQTEEGMEEDEVEKIQEVQHQEPPPEAQIHDDNLEESKALTTTTSKVEPVEKPTEIQPPEATESLTPIVTKTNDDNDALKLLDEPIRKMRRKKGSKISPQESMGQDETVIVGYVNGKPVSASDRSLRHRAGSNSISPSKAPGKSGQNGPNKPTNTVPDPTIELPAENNLEKPPPQTEPMESVEAPPVKEQLTEPSPDTSSSPASKLPSKTREVHRQKSALRSSLPVHSDQPANQAQSATPKRQLRSTSQKPLPTPLLTPASNLITSISSPKPSTLILPPAEQLPPLLLPYPLPITTPLLNTSSESSVSGHPKQKSLSKTVENTQPTEAISEDTHNTQPTEAISEDTHNTQPTEAISEDTHNTQPTEAISEDTHNTQPTEAISEDTHNTLPAQVISEDTPNTQPIEAILEDTNNTQPSQVISENTHSIVPADVISEDSHNTLPAKVVSEDTLTQPAEAISEDAHKPEIVKGSETKQRLRSAKAVTDSSKNDKEHLSEESNPSKNVRPVKTETQTESMPVRSKRVLRNNPDASCIGLIQQKNGPYLEDKSVVEDVNSTPLSDKPTRMPLRSETIKTEMSQQSDIQSPPPNKKLALRSQKSNTPSAGALTETPKPCSVASPVRVMPERTHKAQIKPHSVSVTTFPQNIGVPLITPKQEPPKQTVNKFLQALTGEQNQHLITNLSNKYDKMLKGWVQMDKEGQPAAKYKNKSDRQAAIWKSKRRARKSKSSEQQKYSPVQMLFMKGFDLTSICHWFLESTETKSLVIVKKVNTRLPSETQLCFHSSSSVSGPSQGVFPSIQAERLKKHLKKFAIASPVKSNPKSLKLIAKALEQEANAVKGKEKTELPSSTQSPSKSPSSAKACVQKNESPKSSGNKNPASARILRKYSNIREKMQVQHTTARLKNASKMLKNKKLKTLAAAKSAAKSKLKPSLKGQKSAILVSKKMKEAAAKLKRRKILAAKRSTKYSVKKKAGKAQGGKTSKSTTKKELPKRSSQRLGSSKTSDHISVDTPKSKVGSKKPNEADKPELEKSEVTKVNSVKIQATESCQSPAAEDKGCESSAEVPKQAVGVKAPVSPDQVLTRSQRKMEAEVPLSGSPSNVSKKATKSKSSPKAATEVDEPKLTRSGASKRCQASSLPRSVTKGAIKRAQELKETPAKRARTK